VSVDTGTVVKGTSNPGGYIVSTGLSVLRGDSRSRGPNRRQREALAQAGYTTELRRLPRGTVRVYFQPSGRQIKDPDRARRLGQQLINAAAAPVRLPAPAPAPVPQLPTGGDILDDLLRRPWVPGQWPTPPDPTFEELLKRPRSPAPSNPPAPKRLPAVGAGVLARVLGGIGALLWPTPTASDDVLYPPGTAVPPPEPPKRPRPPVVVTVPESPLETPADKWPGPSREPGQRTPPTDEPLAPPLVFLPADWRTPRPEAVPRPQPVPAPMPAPAVQPRPAPFPLSFPFPFPSLSPRPQESTRPAFLSQPQPQPRPSSRVQPMPAWALSPLTAVQPSAVRSPPSSSDRCTCPRKPAKKRKPRQVCYAGSYVEKATGTTKTPRRKIPCR